MCFLKFISYPGDLSTWKSKVSQKEVDTSHDTQWTGHLKVEGLAGPGSPTPHQGEYGKNEGACFFKSWSPRVWWFFKGTPEGAPPF